MPTYSVLVAMMPAFVALDSGDELSLEVAKDGEASALKLAGVSPSTRA